MTGALFTTPQQRPLSYTGAPLPGGHLWFYRAGTTDLASVYTASDLSTEHANPVRADASGQFPAIFLDPGAGYLYRVVCQNHAGAQEWAIDDYPAAQTGAGGGSTGGQAGRPGLSVAELTIYLRADEAPETPAGGSFDFSAQWLNTPEGWSRTIPEGSAPVWASTAVAAVDGSTATDEGLTWSAPVRVFADGASVDIVFRRAAAQPATPAPSPGVPAGWHTDVDSVPVSDDPLWSAIGTRAHAGESWVWQLPLLVEGPAGPPGADAVLYYLKPLDGAAIKNGTGSLRVEAHRVFGGNDVLLSSGAVQIYEGTTAKGYAVTYDAAAISGSAVLTLKDGPSGSIFDSLTLVDVADGTADTGKNAVYGYVEADGPLVWLRASDGSTWTPAGTTRQLDCTFVQGGAEVARVAHVLTRAADGTITGAPGTHTGGDLNGSRITVTELGEGTTVMAVKFAYALAGDEALATETVFSSLSGTAGTPGATGPAGPAGYSLTLTRRAIPLQAYQNGTVVSYAAANGLATLWQGSTDVTAAAALSATASGCTGSINTAANTPVAGQPKGYYQITSVTSDAATLTVSAVHAGNTITETVSVSRVNVGFEIVASLPATSLFAGRVVFLTTDSKLYRYTGSAWTRAVDGADLVANSITTNALSAGAVTAAKMAVTQLSAVSANLGTVTAGTLQSGSGGMRVDLDNARVIYNSAPGATGGLVRVQGAGFGPAGNYLDWYGPKPAGQWTDAGIIAALTDDAALWHLKTDGTSRSVADRIRGEFEPKAWVVFDGSGGATIHDCYNVVSVTRIAAGQYTITFAAPLANVNYGVSGTAHDAGSTLRFIVPTARTKTAVTIQTRGQNNAGDSSYVSVHIFGSNVPDGSNVTTPSGGYGGGTRGKGNIP